MNKEERPTKLVFGDASGQTGLRTSMSDALGSVTYTFDSMDRLTQEARTLTGVTGTFNTGYGYNIKGDLKQLTYPSGRVVNYTYATGGGCCNSRLSAVSDQTTGVTLANGITFNAAGETLTRTLNPGSSAIAETFSYNNRMELTQTRATKGSTDLMNFSYDYGVSSPNTGRLLSRTDGVQPEHSASYVYDSIYRLSQVIAGDNSWGIVWALDVFGNRTSQTPQALATSKVGTQTLGYVNNRNTSFNYDAAGNQTNDGSHNYTFNALNQITQMDGGSAVYGYDGEGRRMKKTVGSETTYTFYGPGGVLCEFSTTAGTGATQAASTDRVLYRTSERNSTAVLFINAAGVVIENNRTLPYGESWLQDVESVNKKKFTTYDRDAESGLDYAINRFDSSLTGRFMSVDAGPMRLGRPATLNRYAYAMLDPINQIDPDGKVSYYPGPDTDWLCDPTTIPVTVGGDIVYCLDPQDIPPFIPDPGQGGGGGGGGGGQVITPEVKLLMRAADRARTALQKKECAELFGTEQTRKNGFDPTDVLNSILSGGKFGKISFENKGKKWGVAKTKGNGAFGLFGGLPGVPNMAGSVTITINTYNDAKGLYWNDGDDDENAATLLHELAHAYNFLKGSGGFPVNNLPGNDDKLEALVRQKCF